MHRELSELVTAALRDGAQLVGGVCICDHAQFVDPRKPGPTALSEDWPIWAQAVVYGQASTATATTAGQTWRTDTPPAMGDYLVKRVGVPAYCNRTVEFWHAAQHIWTTTTGGELKGTVVGWRPLPE